jgi:hypothetical protein
MRIFDCVWIPAEFNERILKSSYGVVKRCFIGTRCFIVTLCTDTIGVGRWRGVYAIVSKFEMLFRPISTMTRYTAKLAVCSIEKI